MPSGIASKTYRTVAADRRKEMRRPLEFVRGAVEGIIARSIADRAVARVSNGEATDGRRGRATPFWVRSPRPAGRVHGGFAATLRDSCMGLAVLVDVGEGPRQQTTARVQDFTGPD